MSEDGGEDDTISLSKREYLALLGVGTAGAAGYAAAAGGDGVGGGDVLLGGLDAPLTQQYRKGRYVTSPAASFDASDLATGEFAWLTDTGQIGVIDEDGSIGTPPLGSSANPLPSVTTESAGIAEQLDLSLENYSPHSLRTLDPPAAWSVRPHPSVSNPVIVPGDITDFTATMVADPFIVWDYDTRKFYCLYEAINDADSDGTICVHSSADGHSWSYEGVALDPGNHVSFPFTVRFDGDWYMAPQNNPDKTLKIYKATNFPLSWSLEHEASNVPNDDVSLALWDGTWYAFASDHSGTPNVVELYYADSLTGTYTEHSSSPIFSGATEDKLAGRPIVSSYGIDVPYQANSSSQINVYRVTELTTSSFSHTELDTSPVLAKTNDGGWRDEGSHHIDVLMRSPVGMPIAVFDGQGSGGSLSDWQIGLATVGDAALDTVEVDKSASRMYLSSNQTGISSGTPVEVAFDASSFTSLPEVDTANNRFIVRYPGDYQVDVQATWDNLAADTTSFVYIYHNSTQVIIKRKQSVSGKVAISASDIIGGASNGDTITARVFQDSGSDETLASDEKTTKMTVKKVG